MSTIHTIRPQLPQLSPEQWLALESAAGAMGNAGLQILDAIRGDVDAENATDLEDEGLTPRAEYLAADRPGCEVADGGDIAWIERVDQSTKPLPNECWAVLANSEDAEEDDPQGEITDDDPAFDKRSRKIANRTGSGPGCIIADPDYGGEEAGEFDEGV